MPGAVGFPVFFKPDDIAFKQGKVARKLFAPGIGEGRHSIRFRDVWKSISCPPS